VRRLPTDGLGDLISARNQSTETDGMSEANMGSRPRDKHEQGHRGHTERGDSSYNCRPGPGRPMLAWSRRRWHGRSRANARPRWLTAHVRRLDDRPHLHRVTLA